MKKRIRFHINSLSGGGAEKVLVDLLGQLDPEKYEVCLVATSGGVHSSRLPRHIKYTQIIKCRNSRIADILSKVLNKMPARLFTWLFLVGQYDVEIAYLEGRTTRHVAAKKTDGRKLAFVHCDVSVKNNIKKVYTDASSCFEEYESFSKVCFVSEECRMGFFATYGTLSNSCIVHNFIDIDRVKRLSLVHTNDVFQPMVWKIVALGRLAKEKAYERLLYIASELEKKYPIEFWIVGEGKERHKLEKIIQDMNIRSVKLLGYRDNPYPIVKQADLMVCSSLFEGYSTAAVEAIALGVPVVTTQCAGMDEILKHGKCGVITDNTQAALFSGIESLLGDIARYEQIKRNALVEAESLSTGSSLDEFLKAIQ